MKGEAALIGAAYVKMRSAQLPMSPGVYQMHNAEGELLYIGKAKELRKRVGQYTQLQRLEPRKQRMIMQVTHIAVTVTHSEAEALLLEANMIKQHRPPFNILLKDDKSFPYISFQPGKSGEASLFPRIVKHRGALDKNQFYYGPFASAGAVNKAIATLQKAFLLRNCTDSNFAGRSRPCLEYQIKRCTAPCVGYVSEADYGKQVEEAEAVISGASNSVQANLQQEMQQASDAMEYEQAAALRNRLAALQHLLAEQHINLTHTDEADVFVHHRAEKHVVYVLFVRNKRVVGSHAFMPNASAEASPAELLEAVIGQFYQRHPVPKLLLLSHALERLDTLEAALSSLPKRVSAANQSTQITVPQRGEKRQLLQLAEDNAKQHMQEWLMETGKTSELHLQLQELFALERMPERIEVYDNSHIFGQHATGAMIVAGLEGFEKQEYRRFNVDAGHKASGGDDYSMLRQVLTRRLKKMLLGEGAKPDLLLIDGGAQHLSVTEQVMQELNVTDVPYVCIAKGQDRNAGREWFHQPNKQAFQLPEQDPKLHYLQRLRDEAHRFAIFTHRAKRSKALVSNPIDDIPGVGVVRRKALLQHFGSFKALQASSMEDIAAVPGISRTLAEHIHRYLH